MNGLEEELMHEVERFRAWTEEPSTNKTIAEWECDYLGWEKIYKVASDFLAKVDVGEMNEEIVDAVLYIIAADNEMEELAEEVAKYPEKLLYLAQAAIYSSHAKAKWQIAVELGHIAVHQSEAERMLFALAKDEDEYTRRRALGALAEAGSVLVNELIEPACSSGHEYQRMMVLSALYKISSPDLEKYLALAELDGREILGVWAARVRRGEVD